MALRLFDSIGKKATRPFLHVRVRLVGDHFAIHMVIAQDNPSLDPDLSHYHLAASSCRLQCISGVLGVVHHAPVSQQIKVRMAERAVLNTHVTILPSSRAKPQADRHDVQQPATLQAGRTFSTRVENVHRAMKRHERVRATSQQVVGWGLQAPGRSAADIWSLSSRLQRAHLPPNR